MMNYIDVVSERVRLKEGDGVLEEFLSAVYFKGPVSTKEAARAIHLPVPVATAIKKEFIKLDLLKQENGIAMTREGIRYFEEDLGYAGIDRALYHALLGDGGKAEGLAGELSAQYRGIFDGRPQADVTIDQAQGTAETAFKRAALCLASHSLIGKRVLCVGDDDLVSIALALLLRRLYPGGAGCRTRICVFEVDTRFIAYIRELSAAHGFPVECVRMDLKDPLPLELANSFDCFFTDPPYTVEGMSLFLSRGISALKKKKGLHIFLSFGQKPVDENRAVQERILEHGLAMDSILRSFNQYEGASLLGNSSQMMVLQSTDAMRPVIPSSRAYTDKIYTRESKAPDSQYVCKGCGNRVLLGGNEKYRTVEQLKGAGCPFCGGNIFRKVAKGSPEPVQGGERRALGQHILADFYDCGEPVLGDLQAIRQMMREAAQRAEATVVSEEFHAFSPWGISGAIIIQESHLTIHTWPEYRYAAVDLFTCGSCLRIWEAFHYLKRRLSCGNVEYNNISRGLLKSGSIASGGAREAGKE